MQPQKGTTMETIGVPSMTGCSPHNRGISTFVLSGLVGPELRSRLYLLMSVFKDAPTVLGPMQPCKNRSKADDIALFGEHLLQH